MFDEEEEEEEEILGSDDDEQEDPKDYVKGEHGVRRFPEKRNPNSGGFGFGVIGA